MNTLWYLVMLGAGITLLIQSSYFVVRSLTRLTKRVGISSFLMAFMLLSLTTSLAELTVGVNAALAGVPEVSLGDVIGTNIVNLTLILGIVTILGQGIKLQNFKEFLSGQATTLIAIITPFILLLDGELSRIDALLLLLVLGLHFVVLARKSEVLKKQHTFRHAMLKHVSFRQRNTESVTKQLIIFFTGACALIGSGYLIVSSVATLAQSFGLSEFIIGLFVIAIGTSLPELAVGIRAARSSKQGISLGNLFGAVVINMTLVLAVVALIEPIVVQASPSIYISGGVTALVALFVFSKVKKHQGLTPAHGITLLCIYLSFIALQVSLL